MSEVELTTSVCVWGGGNALSLLALLTPYTAHFRQRDRGSERNSSMPKVTQPGASASLRLARVSAETAFHLLASTSLLLTTSSSSLLPPDHDVTSVLP